MADRSLISARCIAAEYLAMAALDLFPGSLLDGGEGTSRCFFYDLIFPFPFSEEILPALEERMRFMMKKKVEISFSEMVATNAAGLMRSRKQPLIAQRLMGLGGDLVTMIRMGEFINWCAGEADSEKEYPFRLVVGYPAGEWEGRPITRVVGVLTEEKRDLKESARWARAIPEHDHQVLNEKRGLLTPVGDGWGWLPSGEKVRREWIALWEKEAEKRGIAYVQTPVSDEALLFVAHQKYFKEGRGDRFGEIVAFETRGSGSLLETDQQTRDHISLFCKEGGIAEECISCLQFILGISRILGFEFKIVLYSSKQRKGARIEESLKSALFDLKLDYTLEKERKKEYPEISFLIADGLGRMWEGPFIRVVSSLSLKKEGDVALLLSVFGGMERLLAVLLEKLEKRSEPEN